MSLKILVPPKVLQDQLRKCLSLSSFGIFSSQAVDEISIVASNDFGSETISVKVSAVVQAEGKFVVDMARLSTLCTGMTELVTLEAKEVSGKNKVLVKHKRSLFKLDNADISSIKLINLVGYKEALAKHVKVDISELVAVATSAVIPKNILTKSEKNTKPFYTAICMEIEPDMICFTSAINSCTCMNYLPTRENNYGTEKLKHILNADSLDKIARVFASADKNDTDCIIFHANYIGIISKNVSFFCAKSSASFPDIRKVASTFSERGFSVGVSQSLFKAALNRAKISVDHRVVLEVFDKIMHIKTPDSSDELELENGGETDEIRIGFNSALMHTIVSSYASEVIEIQMNESVSPFIISSDESNCTFYVMPITPETYKEIV